VKWKKELEALVEESQAFIKRVKADLPAMPPPAGPVLEPIPTARHTEPESYPEELSAREPSMPSRDELRVALPTQTGSERGDLLQRVEEYRALQRRRLQDKNVIYEREMVKIRDGLKLPTKPE
jgi:hypothetical protein